MKKLLNKLFVSSSNLIDDEIIDTQTLHLFRVKLLEAILITASVVGLGTGVLEWFGVLPKDMLYTTVVIAYSLINFLAYLMLRYSQTDRYIFAMHLCVFSALGTFSVMSMSLLYDEFRLIWFFLLSFASFMLGGKWYGVSITVMIFASIYTQFFTIDLHLSMFALFTFTTSLLTFNVFSLIFLNKIEQDSMSMQQHIYMEVDKRETQEKIVQKIESKDIINLKNNYLWDKNLKALTINNKPISLTQKEQLLLALLVDNKEKCVTFEDIQANVWLESYDSDISIQSVKLQVTQLRKKLPKACIKNVYGCGYIFHL